jgi:hypothetical protein
MAAKRPEQYDEIKIGKRLRCHHFVSTAVIFRNFLRPIAQQEWHCIQDG